MLIFKKNIKMKKETLKLDYIETGRLVNGEMSEITGGAAPMLTIMTTTEIVKCGTLTPCPHGEFNKSTCSNYKDCDSVIDKFKCSTYKDFVAF